MNEFQPNINIARKTMFSFLSEGSSALLFLFGILVARASGPEGYGEFTYALAYCGLFALIIDSGLYGLVTRELSRSNSDGRRVLSSGLGLQLSVIPIVIALIIISFVVLQVSTTSVAIVLAAAIAVVCRVLKTTLRGALRGTGRFGIEAISMGFERTSLVLLGIVVWVGKWPVVDIMVSFAALKTIDLLFLTVVVHSRVTSLVPDFRRVEITRVAKELIPFALTTAIWSLYNFTDALMLGYFRGSGEVGQYGAIYQFFEGMVFVPSILSAVYLPLMSYEHERSAEGAQASVQQGMRLLVVASVPIVVTSLIAPTEVLFLVFGADFVSAAAGLQLLLGAAPFVFVFWFLRGAMIAIRRTNTLAILSAAGVVFNIVANLYAIPRYGLFGACLTTLITEFATFAGALLLLRGAGIVGPGPKPWLHSLIAGVVFAACLYLARHLLGWALLGIPAGIIAAHFALCRLRFWRPAERELLHKWHLSW